MSNKRLDEDLRMAVDSRLATIPQDISRLKLSQDYELNWMQSGRRGETRQSVLDMNEEELCSRAQEIRERSGEESTFRVASDD